MAVASAVGQAGTGTPEVWVEGVLPWTTNALPQITDAVARAVAINGVVRMYPGLYKVPQQVETTVLIKGSGDSTIIQSTHTANQAKPSTVCINQSVGAGLMDLCVKGSCSTRTDGLYGVYLSGASGARIERVRVGEGIGSAAIYVNGTDDYAHPSYDVSINDCVVPSCYADGIHITGGSSRVTVDGNKISTTGDDAIAVVSLLTSTQCTDVTIKGNTITNSGSRGVSNLGGKGVVVHANTINGTASAGVLVQEDTTYLTYVPTATAITGNTVIGGGAYTDLGVQANRYGISFLHSSGTISANTVTGAYSDGINVQTAVSVAVTGNTVTTAGGRGIGVQSSSSDVTVSANVITNAGTNGVIVIGSTRVNVSGNIIMRPNRTQTAGIDGVYVTSASALVLVHGNVIHDPESYMERPVEISSDSIASCTAWGNTFEGGSQVPFSFKDGAMYLDRNCLDGYELSADPSAPSADRGRLYFRDNGSGKTQLCVRFNTGAVQVVATQP